MLEGEKIPVSMKDGSGNRRGVTRQVHQQEVKVGAGLLSSRASLHLGRCRAELPTLWSGLLPSINPSRKCPPSPAEASLLVENQNHYYSSFPLSQKTNPFLKSIASVFPSWTEASPRETREIWPPGLESGGDLSAQRSLELNSQQLRIPPHDGVCRIPSQVVEGLWQIA